MPSIRFSKVLVVAIATAGLAACGVAQTETLLQSPDAGQLADPDTGIVLPPDTGIVIPPDTGVVDTGPVDTGVIDTGVELSIQEQLESVDGLTIISETPLGRGVTFFELRFRQPEDHLNPNSITFEHRILLRHRDTDEPLVVHTTGYDLFGEPSDWHFRESEPTEILSANELVVEHRFFGESIASPADWTKMSVWQSASDTHAIFEALQPVYSGAWLGTGVSKGGMTAIFHHRFFPEDYAGIVPYVAPISFGYPDDRYDGFMAQIGPVDGICRTRVRDLGRALITRRVEVAAELRFQNPELQGVGAALIEAHVASSALNYEWGFWQYFGSVEACLAVPDADGTPGAIAGWSFVTPEQILDPPTMASSTAPYYYQLLYELGGPAYRDPVVLQLALDVDWSPLPVGPSSPWPEDPTFNAEPMEEVDQFLRTEAQNVLGIYGAWDPWTGGMPTVDPANDSEIVIVPQIGHAAAASYLPRNEQAPIYLRIEAMAGQRLLGLDAGRSHSTVGHDEIVRAVFETERAIWNDLLRSAP